MPRGRNDWTWYRRGINHGPLISYYRRARENLGPYWGMILAGMVFMLLIGATVVALPHVVGDPKGKEPSGKAQVAPTTAIEVSDATALDGARKSFAPWQILLTDHGTGAPSLLMLMDSGSTDQSDWTIKIQPEEWLRSEPFSLQSLTVSGKQVTITDSYGSTFVVSVGQPFMFESDPSSVFFVSEDHAVWSTTLQTALTNRVKA